MEGDFRPIFELQLGPDALLDEWITRFHPDISGNYPGVTLAPNLKAEDFLTIAALLRLVADIIEENHTPVRRDADNIP
jgi:hypothetical protein